MSWLSAPRRGLLTTAARRPWRLTALLLLALVIAGCGRAAPSLVAPGESYTPITVTNATPIGCVSPARPAPAGGCIVRDSATGISLRVVDAYADVTGTVAELEETNPANYPLAAMNPQLTLASGYVLKGAGAGVTGGPTTVVFDEPLPANDFAPQVQLVASALITEPRYSMPPPSPSPTPPWLDKVNGLTLRVPFTLGPARSAAYTFSQPPAVEHGIGVQVQLLDISPARAAFYGSAGGARVELRFSGLPANMELLSFIRMQWQRATADGTSGDRGPGQLELHIPGMTTSTPVMALLQDPPWPTHSSVPSVEPVVGSAGVVQFEATFLGSGTPTGQPATLSISNIQLLTGGIDGHRPGVPSLPTYSITLPLR